jgi:hypothetical protein
MKQFKLCYYLCCICVLLKLILKTYVHWNYFVFYKAVTGKASNCALNGRQVMQPEICVCKKTSVSPVAESYKIQAN